MHSIANYWAKRPTSLKDHAPVIIGFILDLPNHFRIGEKSLPQHCLHAKCSDFTDLPQPYKVLELYSK